MSWKIIVKDAVGIFDAVGNSVKKDILDLGIEQIQSVSFAQGYHIHGNLKQEEVRRICEELLVDMVAQEYSINQKFTLQGKVKELEIAYNPGVMDPCEESILKGIRDLGIDSVTSVTTSKIYLLEGDISDEKIKFIADKLLYNKLIQHIVGPNTRDTRKETISYQFKLHNIDLLFLADDKLLQISKDGQLFLNLEEMLQIRKYFAKNKRNPTDCELETIAQTWSEHCAHKTFRGRIEYIEKIPNSKIKKYKINNLLKSTIAKVTKELKKPWCVSVFHDNAGVIKFDDKYNVCFKVETHNHPSALEPFGGANTGIGGVIRDPLGTGLGAKPILNTDVFCFAPPDYPASRLPKGTLHPKRVMKGVVSGVRDYGNKMGIPTVNGAIHFHDKFVGNPLVYCGTAGIMPKEKSFKKVHKADLIVVVGGKTGRDGIHGATFSSGELTHESETISSSAVQIGNPIQEKKMVDTILKARDLNLYNAITDCGAGGLSSAVGEMGEELGARVYLEKVPLKYTGLSYTEIWISESQERMVLAVSPKNASKLMQVFSDECVEAVVIGEFPGTGRLELFYKDNKVCDLDMQFLHHGLPQTEKKAVYIQAKHKEPKFACPKDLGNSLLKLLSSYDICSKEWVIRQYDHEVQGGSILKPMSGVLNDGPSDASVVRPLLDSQKGLIVSCGINFRFGLIDPYWMAASCIDEALRQVISSGGSLKQTAILDNFCWGNPDKPDRLGGLVRSAFGCYDIAKGFGVPFISGKDSLYNEYSQHGKSMAIPGTLLISAISVMEDVSKTVSMYAKNIGDLIYIVGDTYDELGGSHYYGHNGALGNNVPRVNIKKALKIFNALSKVSSSGIIEAMHDCSEGGLAVASAEMAFAGGLGMELFLGEVPYQGKEKRDDFILFSESNSRFIVEVKRENQQAFEKAMHGVSCGLIGCVAARDFKAYSIDKKVCLRENIQALKEAWQKPLRW